MQNPLCVYCCSCVPGPGMFENTAISAPTCATVCSLQCQDRRDPRLSTATTEAQPAQYHASEQQNNPPQARECWVLGISPLAPHSSGRQLLTPSAPKVKQHSKKHRSYLLRKSGQPLWQSTHHYQHNPFTTAALRKGARRQNKSWCGGGGG